jgi:hypothetical protein
MAAKDDASTDIEPLTKAFAADMSEACAALRKASMAKAKKGDDKKDDKKKSAESPVVIFSLDPNKATKGRTPAEQAEQIVANKSWVAWGAHMADKARHVIMKADGKVSWDAKKTLGDDFEAFKKKWGDAMKSHGLKNYTGADGWGPGDEFHLELSDSKMAKTDERVVACLDEYARLSRQENKGKNEKFEKDYAKLLAPYLAKYEKKAGK